MKNPSRRSILKTSLGAAAVAGFPAIVPSTVFGQNAPSNRINVGAIGVGRISRGHDLPAIQKVPYARIVAVCDLDATRVERGQTLVNGFYSVNSTKGYHDYRELLANKEIDAVVISTPDHQHAVLAVNAVRAGKDVYLQKPASLTIAEGRIMADAVKASGRISPDRIAAALLDAIPSRLRTGAQRPHRRRASTSRSDCLAILRVPTRRRCRCRKGFNYDAWLGTTPEVYYTEIRVHPQKDFDRPGWLRCEQFGAGMITGWGAHHVDTAHWGMNTEHTGPVEIWG